MQRGYRVALLGQRLDPAPFRQELPDLAAKCGIGFLGLGRLKHFSEDADQGFFDPTMLVVQRFQPLLGCCLCSPDTAQHHLDQFVASTHACLAQQSKHQRMTLARLRDVEKVVHLQDGGFGGELAELGMGDAFQEVSVGCWPPSAVPASVGSLVVIVRLGKCPSTSSGHLTVVPDGT